MAEVGHPRTAEIAAALTPWSGEHAVITTLDDIGAVDRVLGLAAASTGDRQRASRCYDKRSTSTRPSAVRPTAEHTRRELAALD